MPSKIGSSPVCSTVEGADLPAARVLPDLAAEGLGEDLVAEADAQRGRARGDDLAEEGLGAEHPRLAGGDVG